MLNLCLYHVYHQAMFILASVPIKIFHFLCGGEVMSDILICQQRTNDIDNILVNQFL